VSRFELFLMRDNERRTIPVTGNLRVNNGDVIAEACAAGLGMCVAPTFLAWKMLREGRLVRVLPEWQIPDIGINAVYPAGRAVPAKTRSLIDFLVERFGPEPYWDQ
jgi:DNA-binding transcriptional LysR family regulator